jgi:hypothetical protein
MIERAVVLSPAQPLVGVLAQAGAEVDPRRPAVVFLNAGMVHRVGPNRLYVRMARDLAQRGFVSLRFDRSGVGDSPARTDGLPLRAAALGDVRAALDFLAAKGLATSFILIGLCSGADLAFLSAVGDERVVGAVLIDGLPFETLRSRLHHFARWFMRPGNWRRLIAIDGPVWRRLFRASKPSRPAAAIAHRDVPPRQEVESRLRDLTGRGVHLLLAYTAGRDYNYRGQFSDTFPGVRSELVEVAYFGDADHTFTLRANQDLLMQRIDEWIACFR